MLYPKIVYQLKGERFQNSFTQTCVDLFKPIKTSIEDNFQGIEIVGDLKINRRIFIAAELGSRKKLNKRNK